MKRGLKKAIVAVALSTAAASLYGAGDYLEGTIGSPGPRAVSQDERRMSEDAQSQASASSKGEGRGYIPGFIKSAAASVLSALPRRASSNTSLEKQDSEQTEGVQGRSASAGPEVTEPKDGSANFARSASDMPRSSSFSEEEEKAQTPPAQPSHVVDATALEHDYRVKSLMATIAANKAALETAKAVTEAQPLPAPNRAAYMEKQASNSSVVSNAGYESSPKLIEKKVSFPSAASDEESGDEESVIEETASVQDAEVRDMETQVPSKKSFGFDANSVTIAAIVAASVVAIVGCGAYVLNHFKKMSQKDEPIEVM